MKRARFHGHGAEPVAAISEDGAVWNASGRAFEPAGCDWAPATDGVVIGAALNDAASLDALAESFLRYPYVKPPLHPVLYIKPRNTLVGHNALVELPQDAQDVEIGATLGVVFARATRRVSPRDAFDGVQGYTAVIDFSLPQASLFRPPIREKCFDGACPIGPWVTDAAEIAAPEDLEIETRVNGAVVACRTLRDLVRPLAQLISTVSEFMTLRAGDVLLAGVPHALPRAGRSDAVEVEIAGVGCLSARIGGGAP